MVIKAGQDLSGKNLTTQITSSNETVQNNHRSAKNATNERDASTYTQSPIARSGNDLVTGPRSESSQSAKETSLPKDPDFPFFIFARKPQGTVTNSPVETDSVMTQPEKVTELQTISVNPEKENIVMPESPTDAGAQEKSLRERQAVKRHFEQLGYQNVQVFENYLHADENTDPRESLITDSDPMRVEQFHLSLCKVIEAQGLLKSPLDQRQSIVLSVLDDGYDPNHPDNSKNLIIGPDITDEDDDPDAEGAEHGQHVGGIAGANTNNGIGVSGIAPDASIKMVRWYGGRRRWNTQVIVESLLAAAEDNKKNIYNISYNTNSWANDPAIRAVLNDITKNQDVLIFGSAGNGRSKDPIRGRVTNMNFVGALEGGIHSNKILKKAPYSNFGATTVDISAPGSDILSLVYQGRAVFEQSPDAILDFYNQAVLKLDSKDIPPRNEFEALLDNNDGLSTVINTFRLAKKYSEFLEEFSTFIADGHARLSGTSMASPVAAAVAALVWGENPNLSSVQVMAIIKATALNIDAQNPDYVGQLGAGCVQADKAVLMAQDKIPFPGTTVKAVFGEGAAHLTCDHGFDLASINRIPDDKPFEVLDSEGQVVHTLGLRKECEIGSNIMTIPLPMNLLDASGEYTLRIRDVVKDPFGNPLKGQTEFKFEVRQQPILWPIDPQSQVVARYVVAA